MDRQTDGQTTCYSKTALCTIVHRAVINCKQYAGTYTAFYPSNMQFTTRQEQVVLLPITWALIPEDDGTAPPPLIITNAFNYMECFN